MRITCPTCGGKALIRSRRSLSATLSQLYCVCLNPDCAMGFVLSLEFSHVTSPSALSLPEHIREELPRAGLSGQLSLFAQRVF